MAETPGLRRDASPAPVAGFARTRVGWHLGLRRIGHYAALPTHQRGEPLILHNPSNRPANENRLLCNVPEQAALIELYLKGCASRIKDTMQAELEVFARSAVIAIESEEDFWDALSHMSKQIAMLIIDPAHEC